MVFTSWAFVAFFLCVLSALALVRSRTSRQLVILLTSIFFCGCWNKLYLFLLAAPSIIDYYSAIFIEASNQPRRGKFWVVVSLASNLGLLAYFKYANFFLSNFSTWFGRNFKAGHSASDRHLVLHVQNSQLHHQCIPSRPSRLSRLVEVCDVCHLLSRVDRGPYHSRFRLSAANDAIAVALRQARHRA